MPELVRAVIDTNTFVSAALKYGSVPDRAVVKAIQSGPLLQSLDTWHELEDVLLRKDLIATAHWKRARSFLNTSAMRWSRSQFIRICNFAVIPRTTSFWSWLSMGEPMSSLPAMKICWCCIRFGGLRFFRRRTI
jgi:hypothetical protein